MRCRNDVRLHPASGRAGGRRQSGGELQHPRTEVDADDLVRPEVPQGQGVAAAGALEVDRPPAAAMQVADELHLGAEQVDTTRSDERYGFVEPAFVALGRLVPREAVGGVHPGRVGQLLRGRGADVRVIGHPRSVAVASGRGRRLTLENDHRNHPTRLLHVVVEARMDVGMPLVQLLPLRLVGDPGVGSERLPVHLDRHGGLATMFRYHAG